ncbi:MAG: 5-(carboxyamino)imidazole ribonucleotide synthase, partial [Pseudomonadota bacterium]
MSQEEVLPGATLGVLGGGQLGRMFALEAIRMGYEVWVLDADPASPAGLIAHTHLQAAYDDAEALMAFGTACDAVTTEFENVPAHALDTLSTLCRVAPRADALAVAQDRVKEKTLFAECGVPTVAWAEVRSAADLDGAWDAIAGPCILKTARLGYDGKGQVVCQDRVGLEQAYVGLGAPVCVLEQRVDLHTEISVVVARAQDGATAALPIGENAHRNGILHTTRVPAQVDTALAVDARKTADRIVEALDYCGVLAIEFFVTQRGELLANEIAPRPHNSGHYSQLGCAVNQFELQLRSLCDLPLAESALRQPTAMLNLLGDLWTVGEPDWASVLAYPGTELHLYGKREARAGRKMGHVNISAHSVAEVDEALAA